MSAPLATVNGVPLAQPGEAIDDEALRQRACIELLRQAARQAGFDDASAGDAIDKLLERELQVPEPSEHACRRHHAAHPGRWGRGDRLRLRHVLFAVTPGVDVRALRGRAEALLVELRCADPKDDAFADAARRYSNCPSGAQGGELGWLTRDEMAPEFARQVLAQPTVGVLPLLVHSRHGLHVVEVLERQAGEAPPFAAVQGAVSLALRQQAWINALRQYLKLLAGRARIEGVQLDAAATPLLQ